MLLETCKARDTSRTRHTGEADEEQYCMTERVVFASTCLGEEP